ncbi:MAG: SprT-like domain-containing protein [Nitrospiria bacterium]
MLIEQLDLFKSTENRLSMIEKDFSNTIQKKVKIIITRNRSHLISVRKNGHHSVHLRVQEIFIQAPQEVWDAIGRFMVSPTTESRRLIRDFISKQKSVPVLKEFDGRLNINMKGQFYDLNLIYNLINKEYFNDEIHCRITWGKSYKKRRKRSISFGNYESFSNLIKVNPSLDQSKVPDYFIHYIVYHEMLHASFESKQPTIAGRRFHHTQEFNQLEKGFKEYEKAIEWEKKNIHLFIK